MRKALIITTEHPVILLNDHVVVLQAKQHELLLLLALHAGHVVTQDELYAWGWSRHGRVVEPGQVYFQIRRLREAGVPIRCVQKFGYVLMLDAAGVVILDEAWVLVGA